MQIYVSVSSEAHSWLTLCHPMDYSTPGLPVLTNSRSLLKLMSIQSVMPSNHLILCCPLLLLPSIFPSIFSNESALHVKLPTKVHIVKAMVFPVVMYGCECWTIKVKHRRLDAFELWCWRRLLRVPGTAKRSKQLILKEITPEYSLKGLMLKLKLQYFGYLKWRADSFPSTDAGKDWRQVEKGTTQDEMVRWHHWLDGHEFEQLR